MGEEQLGVDAAFVDDFAPTLGDLDLAVGKRCLIQDICHRLLTPRGDLWCHPEYGIDLYRFLHLEMTEINKLDLLQAVVGEIRKDPRIRPETVSASVMDTTGDSIRIALFFTAMGEGSPINLVIGYNLNTMGMEVISGGE